MGTLARRTLARIIHLVLSLTLGTRLGVYNIRVKLGEGDMGQVYRARDTKLDRDVAIKALPEAFVADPERVARFLRKAKTLASLNHPKTYQASRCQEIDLLRPVGVTTRSVA